MGREWQELALVNYHRRFLAVGGLPMLAPEHQFRSTRDRTPTLAVPAPLCWADGARSIGGKTWLVIDTSSLSDSYEALAAEQNAQARGISFEALVARLFEQARFKIFVNPKTARPRQSDLLARSGQEVYLVETKWTKAKANVDDVDSLFRRLDDTPASVVGVLISVSGFTK